MARPSLEAAAQMRTEMEAFIAQGLSTNEIARRTGKSPQAVHSYLISHGLSTVGMRARKKNLDKEKGRVQKGSGTSKEAR